MSEATQSQIDYAKSLLVQLGYDVDDYNFDGMPVWEVGKLIGELKDELEG